MLIKCLMRERKMFDPVSTNLFTLCPLADYKFIDIHVHVHVYMNSIYVFYVFMHEYYTCMLHGYTGASG